jgi:hypothetical protein
MMYRPPYDFDANHHPGRVLDLLNGGLDDLIKDGDMDDFNYLVASAETGDFGIYSTLAAYQSNLEYLRFPDNYHPLVIAMKNNDAEFGSHFLNFEQTPISLMQLTYAVEWAVTRNNPLLNQLLQAIVNYPKSETNPFGPEDLLIFMMSLVERRSPRIQLFHPVMSHPSITEWFEDMSILEQYASEVLGIRPSEKRDMDYDTEDDVSVPKIQRLE